MDTRTATLVLSEVRELRQILSPYKPLSDNEIRLLCISPGNASDTLECSFIHYDLGAANSTHIAISYPWGPPEDPHYVCIIDGYKFIVRQNAFQIITRLRHQENVVKVWIDCLCINQEDLSEKSAQIQLMYSIYKLANCTTIWLGDNGDDTEDLMAYVQSLDIEKIHREFYGQWDAKLTRSNKSFVLDMLKNHPRKEYLINGTARIFLGPYFTRVWIRQEAAVGGNPYILWGSQVIGWKQLTALAWIFMPSVTIDWPDWIDFRFDKLEFAIETVLSLNKYRNNFLSEAERGTVNKYTTSLYSQMFWCRSALTTKAHDKVFALTSICSDLRPGNRYSKEVVKPNYNLSWQEVYVTVAKFFTGDNLSDGAWQFLEGAGLQNQGVNSDLPSWVPDWRYPTGNYILESEHWMAGGHRTSVRTEISQLTKKQRSQILGYKGYTSIGPLLGQLPRDKCNMTRTEMYADLKPSELMPLEFTCEDPLCKDKISKADYTYLESASRAAVALSIRTSMQDTIVYLGRAPAWRYEVDLPQHRHEIISLDTENLAFLDAQCAAGRNQYITDESLYAAYNATIISSQDAVGGIASAELIASASEWRAWLDDNSIDHLATRASIPYHGAIETAFSFRNYVFAYTRFGYMCLVPRFTQLGDKVTVVNGYSLPFVIRPTVQDWHMLVGVCYVHGMMTSKASELIEEFSVEFDEETGRTVVKRPQGDVRANGRKMEAGRYVDILPTLGSRWLKLI